MSSRIESPSKKDLREVSNAFKITENWPKPGVTFRCVSGVLESPKLRRMMNMALSKRIQEMTPDVVVLLDSRGFLLTPAVDLLCLPVVMARKAGKLPPPCVAYTYDLEYGTATIELQRQAFHKTSRDMASRGMSGPPRVVIADDVLATGGTVLATKTLVEQLECTVAGYVFIAELNGLGGSNRLATKSTPVESLFRF